MHGFWRQDARRVAHQVRLVLRGLAGEKAVEILEAEAGRPVLERTGRGGLHRRCVVPLAPGARRVAVILQHLSHQRTAAGDHAGIAVPIVRQFRDLPVADPMMIAPGQQRRPGGRTHRRGVEAVVRDPFVNNAIHRRGLDLATERGRQGGAGVVDQHDENVRRVGGKPPRRRPLADTPTPASCARRCCPRVWVGMAGPLASPACSLDRASESSVLQGPGRLPHSVVPRTRLANRHGYGEGPLRIASCRRQSPCTNVCLLQLRAPKPAVRFRPDQAVQVSAA